MNLLVTGGAGFNGSNLADVLLRADHWVRASKPVITGTQSAPVGEGRRPR